MTLLESFYQTPRVGAFRLSDGGGPFGFDITVACQVDYLLSRAKVDLIVETGCFVGDTLEFLGRFYQDIPVVGIEIDPGYAAVAARRTADLPNVEIRVGDSAVLLREVVSGSARPFVYLDAHWGDDWPIATELNIVRTGLVAVDDVDICDPRFGYDQYGNIRLDASLLRALRPDVEWRVGAPDATYPHPCLQVGRRTGTAFAALAGVDPALLDFAWFKSADLAQNVPESVS